jgi:hypothetical protein
VVSGSEDGNFFVFRRSTGELHGIYEGDGSVVNVIEGHPHLPLVAVSGIDHTVKVSTIVFYDAILTQNTGAAIQPSGWRDTVVENGQRDNDHGFEFRNCFGAPI